MIWLFYEIGISVIICCFLFARQEHFHINLFLPKIYVYKDASVRSLDILNRRNVLCVYVEITALIWQKVNEAFPSQHLLVKS